MHRVITKFKKKEYPQKAERFESLCTVIIGERDVDNLGYTKSLLGKINEL